MLQTIDGQQQMGRFAVDLDVAHSGDIDKARNGEISPAQVRRVTIKGIVDSGAAFLVLPTAVADQLGFPVVDTTTVRYADHSTAQRDVVDLVYLELQGRRGTFQATVEPKRTTALIGAIVLENFDFLVDAKNQRLVPRDPNVRISEIE